MDVDYMIRLWDFLVIGKHHKSRVSLLEEVKVKIIFLDIDGVLNGWDFSKYVKYNIWSVIPSKKIKDFIRKKLSHYTDVDKKRVKRLGKICKKNWCKGSFIFLLEKWIAMPYYKTL